MINVESSSRRPRRGGRGIMVPPKLEFLMMDFAIPSDFSHLSPELPIRPFVRPSKGG